MRTKWILAVVFIVSGCVAANSAEYAYNINVSPESWSSLVGSTPFTVDDVLTFTSTVNNGKVNLTGVNNLAGTIQFRYDGEGVNNTAFGVATPTTGYPDYFHFTGNTTWDVGEGATAKFLAKWTKDEGVTTFTKTGKGTLQIGQEHIAEDNASYNTGSLAYIIEEGTLELIHGASGQYGVLGQYSSITVKDGGTYLVSASRATADLIGSIVLESGGKAVINGSDTGLGSGAATITLHDDTSISGTGAFNFRSSCLMTLAGEGASASITTANVNIYDSIGRINVTDVGSVLRISSVISQKGITKQGAGRLVLSGQNTNTEALTISAGVVEIASADTTEDKSGLGVGTNAVEVANGAELVFSVERAAGLHSGAITVNGGTVSIDAGDINIAAGNTITLANGSRIRSTDGADDSRYWNFRGRGENAPALILTGASSTAEISANFHMLENFNNTITVQEADSTLNITAKINALSMETHMPNLLINGAGTVVFNNANNTFNNALTVAGTATADLTNGHFFAGTVADTTSLTVQEGGRVKVANMGDLGNLATASGKFIFDGGKLELTDSVALTTSTFLTPFSFTGNGAGIILSNENSSLTLDTTVAPGGTFELGGSGNYTIAGTGHITDPADGVTNFLKSGTGSLTINGTNTYTGTTTISAGSVVLGVANALPTDTVLTLGDPTATTTPASGVSLQMGGFDLQISKLTGDGAILNSGTSKLYIDVATGETVTYRGDYVSTGGNANGTGNGIAGATEVHITGGGKFISTGLNKFSGDLYIEDGSHFVAAARTADAETLSATGAATNIIHVGEGATLEYTSARGCGGGASIEVAKNGQILINASDLSLAWGGSKSITLADGAKMSGNGQIQFRGSSTIQILETGSAATLENFTVTFRDSTSFNVAEDSTLYVSSPLGNGTSGTVYKKGAGTIVLKNSSYSAGTASRTFEVQAGTLQIGDDSATGLFTGTIKVNNGATLAINRNDAGGYTLPAGTLLNLADGATLENRGTSGFTFNGTGTTFATSGTLNLRNSSDTGNFLVDVVDPGMKLVIVADSKPVEVKNLKGTDGDFLGPVAFDIMKYNAEHPYIELAGTATVGADTQIAILTDPSIDFASYFLLKSAGISGLSENFQVDTASGIVTGMLSEADDHFWNLYALGEVGNYTGLQLTLDRSAVPEPASWALLLLCVAGVLGVHVSRRKCVKS